jgi:quercetin dioxygenase-like cupin family protein
MQTLLAGKTSPCAHTGIRAPFLVRRSPRLILAGLLALACAAASAAEVKIIAPGAITYKADTNIPGVAVALIDGDPKGGPYTVRAKFSPNVKIPAHFHPDARFVTVISGIYHFGDGDKYDEGTIKGYGPGTVIIIPANAPHFAGTGEDGAIVQESGTGPTGITLTGK